MSCSTPHTYGIMPTELAYMNRSSLALSPAPKATDTILYKVQQGATLADSSVHRVVPLNKEFGAYINPMFQAKQMEDGSFSYSINNMQLLDNRRWGQLYLDRPPFDAKVAEEDIYTEKVSKGEARTFTDYSDMKGGDLKYYVDKSIAPPYIAPTFVLPATVNHEIFTDPMGTTRPQYPRNMTNWTMHNVNPYQQIRDEMWAREDILSRKIQTENQRRYDSRYFS
jgi:hypothetical protein